MNKSLVRKVGCPAFLVALVGCGGSLIPHPAVTIPNGDPPGLTKCGVAVS